MTKNNQFSIRVIECDPLDNPRPDDLVFVWYGNLEDALNRFRKRFPGEKMPEVIYQEGKLFFIPVVKKPK